MTLGIEHLHVLWETNHRTMSNLEQFSPQKETLATRQSSLQNPTIPSTLGSH